MDTNGMSTFKITFRNGEVTIVRASTFAALSNGVTFFTKGIASSFFADVVSVQEIESVPSPLSVLDTCGAPAVSPVSTISDSGEGSPS